MIIPPSREIERKFLVGDVPEDLDRFPRTAIRQGYLAVTDGGTELRVRKEGGRYALTLKEGTGRDRGEHEIEIDAAAFRALWPLTKGKRVKKSRYEVVSEGGPTIAVDVYRKKLKGLVTAEVEFPDEAASQRFQPPSWLGREVTGDETYQNRNLARHGLPQEAGR